MKWPPGFVPAFCAAAVQAVEVGAAVRFQYAYTDSVIARHQAFVGGTMDATGSHRESVIYRPVTVSEQT